jgi:phosphoribosylcarboxyaminoimidazole (NCAIR) mutase
VAILALHDDRLAEALRVYREEQTARVLADDLPCPRQA